MNPTRQRFEASLRTVTNADTGEIFLLPRDRDIEDNAQLERADFEQVLEERREGGESAQAQEGQRKLFTARQNAQAARAKREREEVAHLAVEHHFTLVRPLHGDLQRIQNEATEYNFDMGSSPQWNERKFRDLLLKNQGVEQNGKPLSEQDINNLEPIIAAELGARLARSLRPDSRRIRFTLPPSNLS